MVVGHTRIGDARIRVIVQHGRGVDVGANPIETPSVALVYGAIACTHRSGSRTGRRWYRHDNLHIADGLDLRGLIGIEYGFHLTLVIAGLIVAMFFLRVLQRTPETGAARTA